MCLCSCYGWPWAEWKQTQFLRAGFAFPLYYKNTLGNPGTPGPSHNVLYSLLLPPHLKRCWHQCNCFVFRNTTMSPHCVIPFLRASWGQKGFLFALQADKSGTLQLNFMKTFTWYPFKREKHFLRLILLQTGQFCFCRLGTAQQNTT